MYLLKYFRDVNERCQGQHDKKHEKKKQKEKRGTATQGIQRKYERESLRSNLLQNTKVDLL